MVFLFRFIFRFTYSFSLSDFILSFSRYVGDTAEILYEEWFHCTDLGSQIKDAIERFFATDDYKNGKPSQVFLNPKVQIDDQLTVPNPFSLQDWLNKNPQETFLFNGEFVISVNRGSSTSSWKSSIGEVKIFFFFQIEKIFKNKK